MKSHDFANLFTAYKKKITLEMNVTKLAPCKKLFCRFKKISYCEMWAAQIST